MTYTFTALTFWFVVGAIIGFFITCLIVIGSQSRTIKTQRELLVERHKQWQEAINVASTIANSFSDLTTKHIKLIERFGLVARHLVPKSTSNERTHVAVEEFMHSVLNDDDDTFNEKLQEYR